MSGLLEGLEISILPAARAISDSEKVRIDSGYFSRAAIIAERTIDDLPNHRLGEIASVFRKGIFDIKADTYVETNEGVPFIRIADLKEGLIQKDSTAWISKRAHQHEAKTALQFGDLVISKTAYPAASMVNLQDCNVSQDIIAVRLNALGQASFKPGFVAAFLNTKPGYELMRRRFQGNVQQHLSLDDGKAIRIPRLKRELQTRVHSMLQDADSKQDASAARHRCAEDTLLAALGLTDWTPPSPLTYTGQAQDVLHAKRMDAQFFSWKFNEMFRHLSASGALLKTIRDIRSYNARGLQPDYMEGGDVCVVNSRHILESRIDYDNLERTTTKWFNNNKRARLESGDILTYTTGAKIGRTAYFSSSLPTIASNHVNILRISEGNAVYVAFVMNSLVGRLQTERHLSGTAQPELYPASIDEFIVPFVSEDTQLSIAKNLQGSEELRVQARHLLETAKCAVEIAIDDESAAITFLDQSERRTD